MNNNSITRSVASGATLSGVSQVIIGQSLRFIGMTIVARILLPSDFGILAMVAIITGIAGQLVDAGFTEALVQRKDLTENHLYTAFWANLAIGSLMFLIVWVLSPLFSTFFHNPQVGQILPVSSLAFILTSLSSVLAALLRRNMQFFKISLLDIAEAVSYFAAIVGFVLAGFGIWSMVWGSLVDYLVLCVFRWILSRWRPAFRFNLQSFRELWRFGINIIGTRLVSVMVSMLDALIISRFLFSAAMGFYNIALKVVNTPSSGLSFIGNRVSLPAFSAVQDDNQRLQRGVLKGEAFISIIGIPIFAGLAATAPQVIEVIFGPKWLPSVLPMQIACITGCISILNIGIPSMFQARGRPDINLKLALGDLILLIPALLIGVRFGIVGVASAVAVVTLIMWLVRQLFVHQVITLSFKDYLLSLRPAVFSSIIMAIAILAFRYALNRISPIPDIALLISEIVIGASIYIAILKLSKNWAFAEIFQLVSEILKSFRKTILIKMHLSEEK